MNYKQRKELEAQASRIIEGSKELFNINRLQQMAPTAQWRAQNAHLKIEMGARRIIEVLNKRPEINE